MAASNVSDEKLLCPICLGQFERPRSLPCLHTFCTSCLRAHIETAAQGSLFSSFLCPVCRANTKPARPFAARNQWAEQFPVNYWILSVMDEQISRDHETAYNCEVHPDMKITLFCSDHARLCCAMCVATKHRKCEDVTEIEKNVESQDLALEKKTIETMIGELNRRLREEKVEIENAEIRLENKKTNIVNSIKRDVESAMSNIQRAEDNLLTEIDQLYKRLFEEISSRKQSCERGAAVCEETLRDLHTVDKNEQPMAKFIKVQKAKEKVLGHTESKVDDQNNLAEGGIIDLMRFELNAEFRKLHNIDEIGKIRTQPEEIVEEPQNATQRKEISCVIGREQVQFVQTIEGSNSEHNAVTVERCVNAAEENKSLRLVKRLHTTSASSDTSWITSAVPMKHKTLMVSDHKSSSLKLIKEGAPAFEFSSEKAWGLAKISDGQVAVSYPQNFRIQIYDVKCDVTSVKMKILRKLQISQPIRLIETICTSDACFGICFTGNLLVAACEDFIQTYTLNGMRVQSIDRDAITDGRFLRVVDVTHCHRMSTVYACDEVRNSVIAFNTDMMQIKTPAKFVYTNNSLRCPQSVAVAPSRQVYVTGFCSRNVHVISTEGQCLQIISVDHEPWAVAVDPLRHLLFLSYFPGHRQDRACSLYAILCAS